MEVEELENEMVERPWGMQDDSAVINLVVEEDPFLGEEKVIVDSGCNRIAINKKELFTSLDEQKRRKIQTAMKRAILNVEGVGDVKCLENVYFCPQSAENLVGVNHLHAMGYTTVLDGHVTIYDRETDLVMVQY